MRFFFPLRVKESIKNELKKGGENLANISTYSCVHVDHMNIYVNFDDSIPSIMIQGY